MGSGVGAAVGPKVGSGVVEGDGVGSAVGRLVGEGEGARVGLSGLVGGGRKGRHVGWGRQRAFKVTKWCFGTFWIILR